MYLPGQFTELKIQECKVLQGSYLSEDLTVEVVRSQAERRELSTHPKSCRDASLQRVDAKVEHPQPAQAAELRRYRAGEAVVAEVERPEERQVAEER
jgi:hypothetical protein